MASENVYSNDSKLDTFLLIRNELYMVTEDSVVFLSILTDTTIQQPNRDGKSNIYSIQASIYVFNG